MILERVSEELSADDLDSLIGRTPTRQAGDPDSNPAPEQADPPNIFLPATSIRKTLKQSSIAYRNHESFDTTFLSLFSLSSQREAGNEGKRAMCAIACTLDRVGKRRASWPFRMCATTRQDLMDICAAVWPGVTHTSHYVGGGGNKNAAAREKGGTMETQ